MLPRLPHYKGKEQASLDRETVIKTVLCQEMEKRTSMRRDIEEVVAITTDTSAQHAGFLLEASISCHVWQSI